MEFTHVDPANYKLNAVVSVNTQPTLKYHRANNFTRSGFRLPPVNGSSSDITQKLELIVMQVRTAVRFHLTFQGWAQINDLVIRAFGNYSLKYNNRTSAQYSWMTDSLDSARFAQAMPFYQEVGALIMAGLDGIFCGCQQLLTKFSDWIISLSDSSYSPTASIYLLIGARKEAEVKRDDESAWNEDMALLFRELHLLLLFIHSRGLIFLDLRRAGSD